MEDWDDAWEWAERCRKVRPRDIFGRLIGLSAAVLACVIVAAPLVTGIDPGSGCDRTTKEEVVWEVSDGLTILLCD
jgi:hypothetical protein